MDVALEICDTFVLDHVYAALHPAAPTPYDFPGFKANHTGAGQTFTSWQYSPSTHLFTLEPSQAAYLSAWPRDNIYRQFISAFALTWYARRHQPPRRRRLAQLR